MSSWTSSDDALPMPETTARPSPVHPHLRRDACPRANNCPLPLACLLQLRLLWGTNLPLEVTTMLPVASRCPAPAAYKDGTPPEGSVPKKVRFNQLCEVYLA